MWNAHQRYRLALEKAKLERELPQFHFYDPTGDTYVSGVVWLANACLSLMINCVLGPSFPDEMPQLYVVSPLTLWKYGWCGTVNAEEYSHAFHTSKRGPGGCVQICHCRPDLWDPRQSLVSVLKKSRVWCAAYDAHLRTGKPLCDFCGSE